MQQSTGEQWRPVVGYEGLYEVSDHGRVRSLDRITRTGNGDRLYRSRFLEGYISLGYRRVALTRGGKSVHYLVHRLVLEAFVGPCPDGMEGCHNNGDRADARLSNLRWDTRLANIRDKFEHGTDWQTNKTHCPRGHVLAAPNLTAPRSGGRAERSCLACARGRAARQHHPHLDLQQVSDEKYARIMSGE